MHMVRRSRQVHRRQLVTLAQISAGDGASNPAQFITRSLITPYGQWEALGEKAIQ